jgi:hypothetical protein
LCVGLGAGFTIEQKRKRADTKHSTHDAPILYRCSGWGRALPTVFTPSQATAPSGKNPRAGQQIPDGRSSSPVHIGFCVRCRRSGSPCASVTSPVLGARAVVRRGTQGSPTAARAPLRTIAQAQRPSLWRPRRPRCRCTIDSASPVLVAASTSALKRSTIWSRLRQHNRANVSGTSRQKPEP